MAHKKKEGTYHCNEKCLDSSVPGKGVPLLLIPEYSGINKSQRVPDRSKTAHRKPLVKCFLTNATLSICPTLSSTPPHVHKSVVYNYISIPALQISLLVPFSRFHVYELIYNICFSLSDLLHSVWQTLGSYTSLQVTQFHSFLWLSNIPPYMSITSSLSIHLSDQIENFNKEKL